MSGKGSKIRPKSVSNEEFSKNWEVIFGGENKPSSESIAENITGRIMNLLHQGVTETSIAYFLGTGVLWRMSYDSRVELSTKILQSDRERETIYSIVLRYINADA